VIYKVKWYFSIVILGEFASLAVLFRRVLGRLGRLVFELTSIELFHGFESGFVRTRIGYERRSTGHKLPSALARHDDIGKPTFGSLV
jgi:hypothetical protein